MVAINVNFNFQRCALFASKVFAMNVTTLVGWLIIMIVNHFVEMESS